VRLRPKWLRDYPHVISAFLKSIDFNREKLGEYFFNESRPVLFRRLAVLFEQVGKIDEAKLIKSGIKATTKYSVPGKSQIIKNPLPASLASAKRISDPPYVIRLRDQLLMYGGQVTTIFRKMSLPNWRLENFWRMRNILKNLIHTIHQPLRVT